MKYFVYIYLMFIFAAYGQEHILIGDSQTYLLINTKHSNIVTQVSKLCQSGIGVQDLIQKVKRYPIKTNVKTVTICIGVNDNYVDKGVEKLILRIRKTFPNAKLLVIKGSWDWGRVKRLKVNKFNDYYKIFEKLDCELINTPIGKGNPHSNKKVYETIMKELENKIKNEQTI
jgi:hypothetical protein